MKQQRHFWKLEKDWERIDFKLGKVKTEVCLFCGCKRETWKFDYLPKNKSFYLFLKANSKKKKFTTEHVKCDKAVLVKEELDKRVSKHLPEVKQQPTELKVIKHNPVVLANLEAQLKDSIIIIQLLITKMEENNLKGKEFEIANRFISSIDVEHWKERFNKTAI